MAKLLRNRWLHRALVLAVLLALGVGIYNVQEPEPLCVIDAGGDRPVSVANGQLITFQNTEFLIGLRGLIMADNPTPLRFWDLQTGDQVQSYFEDESTRWHTGISADKRQFVAEVGPANGPRSLVFIDLAEGGKREITIGGTCEGLLHFSPDGAFLMRIANQNLDADKANTRLVLEIYDWAGGTLIARRPTLGLVSLAAVGDDAVLHFRTDKVDGKQIEVVNLRDGALVATVPENDGAISVSPDGKYVVTDRRQPDIGRWTVEIWNARAGKLESSFQPDKALLRTAQCFSRDGRWLANSIVREDGGVHTELRDFPAGTVRGQPAPKQALAFSPDGRLLAIEENSRLTMAAIPSMEPLWKSADGRPVPGVFSRDSQTAFVLVDDPPELRCLASATGQITRKIPLRVQQGFTQAWVTPDQRLLVATGVHMDREFPKWVEKFPWLAKHLAKRKNDAVVVLDTDSCRTRLHLVGWNAMDAWLSDDGRTLVTTHQDTETLRVLRAWDVDAWKPLHLPIGVPAGLGTLVTLFAWWRGRRVTKTGGTPCPS